MIRDDGRRVLLGMSGGTDSSVSALLLQDMGFEVTGITFRFYEKDGDTEYLDDALSVCKSIGIPHLVYDARKLFESKIIRYFISEYLAGKTPVPCIICNNQLKWPLLAQIATENGICHIATGHYAQMDKKGNSYHIICGKDRDKDQSFFLWGLTQELMSRIIFPLGTYTKQTVREIAATRQLAMAASKKDSIGVCFCPRDYRSFLRQHVDPEFLQPGWFYNTTGEMIGQHQGYPFYTIGQRRGLGVQFRYPVFVKEIIPQSNSIVLDQLSGLYKTEMTLKNYNFFHPDEVFNSQIVTCKIRYRKQATPSVIEKINENQLRVKFLQPLEAIAPGQAAAFYRQDCLLGGGIIE